MRSRLTLAALALSLAVGACNQDAPTSANTAPDNQQPAPDLKKQTNGLLTNLPVSGPTLLNGCPDWQHINRYVDGHEIRLRSSDRRPSR